MKHLLRPGGPVCINNIIQQFASLPYCNFPLHYKKKTFTDTLTAYHDKFPLLGYNY